jgi:hypothetical protein
MPTMLQLAIGTADAVGYRTRGFLHGTRDKLTRQVQAFGVSMKHALRGESGPFYSDLYDLIAWLPK